MGVRYAIQANCRVTMAQHRKPLAFLACRWARWPGSRGGTRRCFDDGWCSSGRRRRGRRGAPPRKRRSGRRLTWPRITPNFGARTSGCG